MSGKIENVYTNPTKSIIPLLFFYEKFLILMNIQIRGY